MSRVSVFPTKLTFANSRTPCSTTRPPCKYTLTSKSVVTSSSNYNSTFQMTLVQDVITASSQGSAVYTSQVGAP